MPSRTFRFVQASDFRLEQPPHGLAEVPDHLTEPLIEAAYRAAAAVFDLALAEDVDFVVLAGHLVEPELAGPRGPTFLAEQFSRLAARGIRVYWAAAPADGRRNWPITLVWPDTVHVFDSRRVERVVHVHGGEPLCVLIGRSIDEPGDSRPETLNGSQAFDGNQPWDAAADLQALTTSLAIDASALAETTGGAGADAHRELFRIAIAPFSFSATALDVALAAIPASAPPCFLAVGGVASSTSPGAHKQPIRMAHCSGSPQGRAIGEVGPHGATLVEVDPLLAVRTVLRTTDALRWHDERITLPAGALRAELDHRLHERMAALIAAAPERTLLVRWTIDGPNSLVARARQTGLMTDLLVMLRTEYGRRTPAAWSISVAAEHPAPVPESWYDQQTLLGEFLRSVRALEKAPAEKLTTTGTADGVGPTLPDLHRYLPEHLQTGTLAASVSLQDATERLATLREAAQLGAELLRPIEAAH